MVGLGLDSPLLLSFKVEPHFMNYFPSFQVTTETTESNKCLSCSKDFKTKRGLKIHVSRSHKEDKKPKLHPLQLKSCVERSVLKLAKDMCYPESIRKEFNNYSMSYEEILTLYQAFEDVIDKFSEDFDKFYPLFYAIVSRKEGLFKLTRNCYLLLGMELANQIIALIVGIKNTDHADILQFNSNLTILNEKEKNALAYLSGYVCGTLYRRIRKVVKDKTDQQEAYLAILLATKIENDNSSSKQLVNIKNRGGLWSVSDDTVMIFHVAETLFVKTTALGGNKIEAQSMVDKLLVSPIILSCMSLVCKSTALQIDQEIKLNLLEHMLTLFIRVRAFSYAKDKKQAFRRMQKKAREKSLRTELKKSSTTCELGKLNYIISHLELYSIQLYNLHLCNISLGWGCFTAWSYGGVLK